MATKRLKGGSATGGTGDLKPQILTMSGLAGAITDYVVVQVQLPVPRFGPGMNKATITEILKVWFYPAIEDLLDDDAVNATIIATTNLGRANADAVTVGSLATDMQNSNIVAATITMRQLTTSGSAHVIYPLMVDVTDSNGNGVLVAADSIFLIGANIAGTVAGSYTAKILYRTVNVGVTEYVGILQSQR